MVDAIGDGKDLEEVVEVALKNSKNKRAEATKVFRQAFLELRTPVRRRDLEKVWPIPIDGHDLWALWKGAKSRVRDLYDRESFVKARASSVIIHGREPLPPEKLAAVCEVFGRWDPGGDGIRYPAGLDGKWYVHLPQLNLLELERLARDLEITVLAYERALP